MIWLVLLIEVNFKFINKKYQFTKYCKVHIHIHKYIIMKSLIAYFTRNFGSSDTDVDIDYPHFLTISHYLLLNLISSSIVFIELCITAMKYGSNLHK